MQKKVIQKECKKHGLTNYVLLGSGYYRCRLCRTSHVTKWRKNLKAKLISEFGGKCQICGYCKCQEALQFHHIDPTLKEFSIAQYGNTRAYEKSREEAKKCILLCANCHAEVEADVSSLPVCCSGSETHL